MAIRKAKEVNIPSLNIETVCIDIVSKSALIVNYPKDLPLKLLDIQNKTAKSKRPDRDPEQEYLDSLYKFSDYPESNKTGFCAVGFKAAIARGAKIIPDLTMIDTQGAVFVLPDDHQEGLVEIRGEHVMRTDRVVLKNRDAS